MNNGHILSPRNEIQVQKVDSFAAPFAQTLPTGQSTSVQAHSFGWTKLEQLAMNLALHAEAPSEYEQSAQAEQVWALAIARRAETILHACSIVAQEAQERAREK